MKRIGPDRVPVPAARRLITSILVNEAGVVEPHSTTTDVDRATSHRARPPGPPRTYLGDLRRFLAWCTERGLLPTGVIPLRRTPPGRMTEEQLAAGYVILLRTTTTTGLVPLVAEYVGALAEAGKPPATLDRALTAISTAHRSTGAGQLDTGPARAVVAAYRRSAQAMKRRSKSWRARRAVRR
jgi:hypothetical protein